MATDAEIQQIASDSTTAWRNSLIHTTNEGDVRLVDWMIKTRREVQEIQVTLDAIKTKLGA